MLQILVRSAALAVGIALLAACGQKGNLYLPVDPAAADRATLPQAIGTTLRPPLPKSAASDATPSAGALTQP